MKSKSSWLTAAAVVLAGLGTLVWELAPSGQGAPAPGSRAPEFSAADLSGRTVRLSGLRGKTVLLDFWATWCPSCISEIPALERIQERFSPRGLELLAASVDETGPQAVADFASRRRLSYRVLFADSALADAYSVRDLPTKYLIAQDGTIYRRYVGEVDAEELEADIDQLLNARRAT